MQRLVVRARAWLHGVVRPICHCARTCTDVAAAAGPSVGVSAHSASTPSTNVNTGERPRAQRSELSKKAVGLVAGVLGAGSGGQARLGQGSEGAEGGAHQPQRLHVASSSLEVERQVRV